MKKIFVIAFLSTLLFSCAKHPDAVSDNHFPIAFNESLIQIDSLMQSRPDSALMCLISREPQGQFDNNYFHLLLSEALFKTDNSQLNRPELLAAIPFFDSVYNSNFDNKTAAYLAARIHYINGVGFYENDGVIEACCQYYLALNIMEPIGRYHKFLSLAHTRLANIYSDKFLIDPAIFFYKNALKYKKRDGRSNIANTLFFIGYEYEKGEKNDSALYYYNLSLDNIADTNSLLYRNVINRTAIATYLVDNDAEKATNTLKDIITNGDDYEKYDRLLGLGYIYILEKQYDTAKLYLDEVFNDAPSVFLRTQSANHLNEIYEQLGDTTKSGFYSRFITQNTPAEFGTKADEWQLTNLYQDYLQKKQHQEVLRERLRTRYNVVVVLIIVAAVASAFAALLIKKRNKKHHTDYDAFVSEPVCQGILKTAHEQQFKSKMDCAIYKDYALTKEQMLNLRTAADNHLNGFTERIRKKYSEISNDDVDYCLLYLLGMKESDIAAFMQKAYSTVSDRSRKLKKIFGSEYDLTTIIRNIATK